MFLIADRGRVSQLCYFFSRCGRGSLRRGYVSYLVRLSSLMRVSSPFVLVLSPCHS